MIQCAVPVQPLKMAKLNNRRYIGIEISEEYCRIAQERLQMINQIQEKPYRA